MNSACGYYVVGSGPSGVIAAQTLLEGGASVTLLDVGQECEPEIRSVVEALSRQPRDAWDPAMLAKIDRSAPEAGIPRKLCYGSDFPYAEEESIGLTQEGTRCLLSHARGGLSNVWGASVLPALPDDLRDWPVGPAEMAPHYEAVARVLQIAGAHDELETLFPYHHPPRKAVGLSRQAQALLIRMRSSRPTLNAQGIHFGQSRLAVRTEAGEGGRPCQRVGRCLTGCPYGAIWNAADRLDILKRHPRFAYRNKIVVRRLEQQANGRVRIHAVLADSQEAVSFDAGRVFLGCGPLSTARIVIDSLPAHDREFRLQFQPYFLLPLLSFRRQPDVDREDLHTLAQLYIEILDAEISAHPVHLQIYTFNELAHARLRRAARWFGYFRQAVVRQLAGRLLVIQGYLDSSECRGIELRAFPDRAGGGSHLRLRAVPSPETGRKIGHVARKLLKNAGKIGAFPLLPLMQTGTPGDGNHIGGIFPMRRAPERFESDILGRLPDMPGVHIVDASVLPTLPSTTFTYTMMANARRIAMETLRHL